MRWKTEAQERREELNTLTTGLLHTWYLNTGILIPPTPCSVWLSCQIFLSTLIDLARLKTYLSLYKTGNKE